MHLSKEFDRVDHVALFKRLQNHDLPSQVIMLLKNWYVAQKFYVQWESAVSESFKSVNGVRQGGILSPLLCSLYVDELSVNLRSVPYACYINSVCINHIMYADDTDLFYDISLFPLVKIPSKYPYYPPTLFPKNREHHEIQIQTPLRTCGFV